MSVTIPPERSKAVFHLDNVVQDLLAYGLASSLSRINLYDRGDSDGYCGHANS